MSSYLSIELLKRGIKISKENKIVSSLFKNTPYLLDIIIPGNNKSIYAEYNYLFNFPNVIPAIIDTTV